MIQVEGGSDLVGKASRAVERIAKKDPARAWELVHELEALADLEANKIIKAD